jgi:site-specific DNA recombinase
MRAAIYLRQSLDVSEGIERQRTRTKALVKARGWTLVGEYQDNATSATKARGSGTDWARLLGDLEAKRVEVVVAVDVDRLVRTQRDLITLIDHGAKVVTVDGEIDLSAADGEFRAMLLASLARFEVRRKSERQKRANEHRIANGQRTGSSRRQFGYDRDGVTVVDAEAGAIRDGYAALLSGVPLAGIARDWNARGLTTTQRRQARSGHEGEPSPWTAGSVRAVLSNARNAGIVTYLGNEASGAGEASWPALVDEATFRATVALLRDPARRTSAPRYGKHLLSGLARCGVAGCEGHAHAGGNARRGVKGYRCSAAAGHFARMAEPIEEYVVGWVIEALSADDARDLLVKPAEDTRALRREALALGRRLNDVAGLVADGTLTAAQARSAADRLKVERAAVEVRIADAGRVDVLGPLVGAEDVRAAWEGLDTDRQRAVIDTLMTVTIYPVGRGSRTFRPQTVGIAWKGDDEAGQGAEEGESADAAPAVLIPTPSAEEVAQRLASGWDRHRLAEHYGRTIRTVDRWINYANAAARATA